MMKSKPVITLILGAGASRAVSYGAEMPIRSPLDADFFQMLQRLVVTNKKDANAIRTVLEGVWERPGDQLWASMERLFYTLHRSAVIRYKVLEDGRGTDIGREFIAHFARAVLALLRAAHGKKECDHHKYMFSHLLPGDAIMTFNYDLVAERALRRYPSIPQFGPWIYGFGSSHNGAKTVPILHKLHGSVNWHTESDGNQQQPELRQKSWIDFDKKPGYQDYGPAFSILLPYWEKRVWISPWRGIWTRAARQLRKTTSLIIWGYSLPFTDMQARELIRLTLLSSTGPLDEVCVIDPSREAREKWRGQFVHQRFWEYDDFASFQEDLPPFFKYGSH